MAITLHYPFSTNPVLTDAVNSVVLSMTRATTAKMKDADGWLREVQSGEARFPGASFSHNTQKQSQDFETTWTVNSSLTVTAGQSDPWGGTNAFEIEDPSAVAFSYLSGASMTSALKAGGVYIASAFIKKDTTPATTRWMIFRAARAGGTARSNDVCLDTSTGSTNNRSATTVDVLDYGAESYDANWWRVYVVWKEDSGNNAAHIEIYPACGNNADLDTLSSAVTGSVIATGAQIEDVSGAWDSDNQVTQSNTFSSWSAINVTVASGQSDPDGGSNAWSLKETAAGPSAYRLQSALTIPTGRYFFSLKAKASNRDWIAVTSGFSGTGGTTYFDLTNGVVGTDNNDTSGITALGGGWYLCYVSFEVTSADPSNNLVINIAEADNDLSFSGVADQEAHLIYQSHLERAKPNQTAPGTYVATTTAASTTYSPSTYIPTTTAAVSSLSGTNDGLLVEEARTNICLQSEDITTTWTSSLASLTANQTIAPDGSLTADLFQDDGATGTGSPYIQQAFASVSTSTTYTYSQFFKADQLSWVAFLFNGWTTPAGNPTAYFDLGTGAVGTVDAGLDDSGIEDYGNGWYRCWVSFTTDSTDDNGFIRAYLADADGDLVVDRDGTSSIFVWGAQLEAGAFPTSYIPTTTGAVTRNADNIKTTDLSWYSSAGGGTFYDAAVANTISASGYLWSINNDAYSERWVQTRGSAGGAANNDTRPFSAVATGTDFGQFSDQTNNWVSGTVSRCAQAMQTDDFTAYVDGAQLTPKTSGDVPTKPTLVTFDVGSDQSDALFWNGLIKEIAYDDTRLPNATLEGLSDGTITVSSLIQTGTAWEDYIPVYVVTGRTKRWRTDDSDGFIPVVYK